MMCEERDQNLLLLAHGALPLWQRWMLQAHLLRCPVCQRRYAQLTESSRLLSSVLHQPGRPMWSPVSMPAPASAHSARLTKWSLLLLALFLSLATLSIRLLFPSFLPLSALFRPGHHSCQNVTGVSGPNRPVTSGPTIVQPPATGASTGCDPGLPNDHCR